MKRKKPVGFRWLASRKVLFSLTTRDAEVYPERILQTSERCLRRPGCDCEQCRQSQEETERLRKQFIITLAEITTTNLSSEVQS